MPADAGAFRVLLARKKGRKKGRVTPPSPAKKKRSSAPSARDLRGQGPSRPAGRFGVAGGLAALKGMERTDAGRLLLLALGMAVVLYLSFESSGFYLASRSYAQLAMLYLVFMGLLFHLPVTGGLTRTGKLLFGLFGGYTLWILVSTIWSLAPAESFNEFNRAVFYLSGFSLCWLYLARPRWLEWLAGLFILVAAVVALDSLLGKALPDLIDHPDLFGTNRLTYPLTYWNTIALMMLMAFPLALRLAADREAPLAVRLLSAPALVLMSTVIFFTFSRAGLALLVAVFLFYLYFSEMRLRAALQFALTLLWSGLIIAVCYLYLPTMVRLMPNPDTGEAHKLGLLMLLAILGSVGGQLLVRRYGDRVRLSAAQARRLGRALAAGVAAVVLVLFLVFTISSGGPVDWLSRQVENIAGEEMAVERAEERLFSVQSERYREYAVSLRVFAEEPLLGTGAGTWSFSWLEHRNREIMVKDGHSWLFETMAELGIVGTVLLVGFIGTLLVMGVRELKRLPRGRGRELYLAVFAACVIFVAHSLIDWDWEMPAVALPFFMFAGSLLRYGAIARPAEPGEPAGSTETAGENSRGGTVWRWAAGVGCVVAMVAVVPPLLSENLLEQARQQYELNNYTAVRDNARTAQRLNPLDAEALFMEAAALQLEAGVVASRGDSVKALALMQASEALIYQALEIEPRNDRYYRNLALLYVQMNEPVKAEEAALQAWRLNPKETIETKKVFGQINSLKEQAPVTP